MEDGFAPNVQHTDVYAMEISWLYKTIDVLVHYYSQNPLPYFAILAWFLFSVYYVVRAFRNYEAINRYLLQMIPFGFTALGLLGTITGIMGFVWRFTPNELMNGALTLFKGILASGTTAVLGITLAIVFSKLISMTHYKVEMRKALENNELYVLKQMLKLDMKGYAKVRTEARETLAALTEMDHAARRDAAAQTDAVTSALVGGSETPLVESLVSEIREMRQDLQGAADSLLKAGERQNELLSQIAKSLSADDPAGVSRQLQQLRGESKQRTTRMIEELRGTGDSLRQGLGAQSEALDSRLARMDASLKTAIQEQTASTASSILKQTQVLGETIKASAGDLNTRSVELGQEFVTALSGEMESARALAKENADSLSRDVKQAAESTNQAVREAQRENAEQRREQHEALGKSTEELTNIAREQGELLAVLMDQVAPKRGENLVQRLNTMRAKLRELREQGQEGRIRTEKALQNHQEALTSMQRELGEFMSTMSRQQVKAATDAALRALRDYEGAIRPEVERLIGTNGRETREALRRLGEDMANRTGSVNQNLRTQQGGLDDIGNRLRELGANMQVAYGRIEELAQSTRDMASEGTRVKELVQEVNLALNSGRELQKIVAMVERAAIHGNGSNGNGKGKSTDKLGNSMQRLISRLGEIDTIKKTDERFWRQVERQMNDGIPIIMGGNKLSLHDDLNGSFQNRLQQSFLNLDKILQAIVEGYQRKSNTLTQ